MDYRHGAGIYRFCAFEPVPPSWGFGFHLPGLLTTALFLFGLFACAFILGILVNILILSFGQKVEITAWMFAQLFMILCGMYYPVDMLPKVFQYLALMVPITHFLEFFRQSYGFKAHTPVSVTFWFCLDPSLYYSFLALFGPRLHQGPQKRHHHPIIGIRSLGKFPLLLFGNPYRIDFLYEEGIIF